MRPPGQRRENSLAEERGLLGELPASRGSIGQKRQRGPRKEKGFVKYFSVARNILKLLIWNDVDSHN